MSKLSLYKLTSIVVLTFLMFAFFTQCKKEENEKKTVVPINTNQNLQPNYLTCKIGNVIYNTDSLTAQHLITQGVDSLLMVYTFSQTDTINVGFTLHVSSTGTFTHNPNNVSETNRFVLNFGDLKTPQFISFTSTSGTIQVTKYDRINHEYAGTFSATLTLTTNPNYTISMTNGSFHYKP